MFPLLSVLVTSLSKRSLDHTRVSSYQKLLKECLLYLSFRGVWLFLLAKGKREHTREDTAAPCVLFSNEQLDLTNDVPTPSLLTNSFYNMIKDKCVEFSLYRLFTTALYLA